MKKDIYKINNSIDKLINGKNTLFLDKSEFNLVKYKIKANNYQIYTPFKEADKIILYSKKIPDVTLFRINTNQILKHQEILGSILSLNISHSYLGDIIINNQEYYFFILSDLKEYIKENLTKISNYNITLETLPLDYLKDYEREYESIKLIVTSTRIDNVLSKLIKTNRDRILDKIKDKEILLNYTILTKASYILKENDVFSVRKYGKYIYKGILNTTKRNNYIIEILKYK